MQRTPARMPRPLAGLTWRNAGRESLAGVTLLAIAVPLNIGYAQIAGLPATAGLYALIVPAIVYALLVSSRQVVASPDAAAAALVASSVGGLALAGSADYATMAMAQAILSGVMFFAASVFRLGFLANFLSKPILVGFVGGLALDIMVSQFAKMLGVSIDSSAEFATKVGELARGLGTVSWASVAIAAGATALLVVGRRYARAVPWALIALVLATVVVSLADLEDAGVAVLGPIEGGIPTLTWPMLDLGTWLALIPSALALTMVTTAEGLLVARSYAEKSGVRIHPDRDLLAFGAANIASGVSGSFAVGSSTSRTAAMDQAGSRTQLPTLIVGAGTLLLLLFGTALLESIPLPAIGAVVAVAIVSLLGIRELRDLWGQDRFEFVIGAVCFLATLLIGAIPGIFIALILALLNVAKRAANPQVDVLAGGDDPASSLVDVAPAGEPTAPGVLIVRVSAPLFFANIVGVVDAIKRLITAQPEPVRHLVLDLESVTDIDVTAADALDQFRTWLRARDVALAFSRVRHPLRERMRALGILGEEAVYPTNRAALDTITQR